MSAKTYILDKDGLKMPIGDKDGLASGPIQGPNHFELIAAAGIADLNAGRMGRLGVTSSETDTLITTSDSDWNTFAAQAGVGYVYYFPGASQYSNELQWFPAIEPELNAYYLAKTNFKGDVLRFNSPSYNDMTYSMSVQSSRLMADAALTIVSKKQYSLYAIGGIGGVWNHVNYSDLDKDAVCAEQRLGLSHTGSDFAWEAGAGLSYAFNDRVSLSLEYLYADLGTAETAAHGNTGTITAPVIIPAHFSLSSQAALLGIHFAL